jgi:hypothetical protein
MEIDFEGMRTFEAFASPALRIPAPDSMEHENAKRGNRKNHTLSITGSDRV